MTKCFPGKIVGLNTGAKLDQKIHSRLKFIQYIQIHDSKVVSPYVQPKLAFSDFCEYCLQPYMCLTEVVLN